MAEPNIASLAKSSITARVNTGRAFLKLVDKADYGFSFPATIGDLGEALIDFLGLDDADDLANWLLEVVAHRRKRKEEN